MPAYAVSNIIWGEAKGSDRHVKLVQNALKPFGGKYLAFSATTVVEGSNGPSQLALVEFPSMDAAKRFYESTEYSLARNIRAISAQTSWLVFIDGISA